jgi:hypothetical protein
VDLQERSPSLEYGGSGNFGPSYGSSPPVSVSFSGRKRRVPGALKDFLPHSLAGLAAHLRPKPIPAVLRAPTQSPAASPGPEPPEGLYLEPEPDTHHHALITTEPNGFGLYRQYTRAPRIDPEDDITLYDLHNLVETPRESVSGAITGFYHPFPNATTFWLLHWFYQGSPTKSKADLDSIVRNVIRAEDFDQADVKDFSADRELARLDEYGRTNSPFLAEDGWREGAVKIHVPNTKSKFVSESVAPAFEISGVHYRPLLEVIKGAFQSPDAKRYHWVPFKLFHHSPDGPVRVYSDIYNSNAMLEEDAKIQALP